MKNIINSVRGTREFYPQEMALRNWFYENLKSVSHSFGYSEYDGPFLESIDLYAAKSGEELVKEQSFTFPDRGGNLITLRPELTPSLARMVAQKQHQLNYPLRWWSFGPFWRYEKPQKGRTREFFQWNIDLIGSDSPQADAEMIAIAAEFFRRVGLKSDQVKILVNDRRLMDRKLSEIGISGELKQKALSVIDRQDKMRAEDWKRNAIEEGFSEKQFNELIRILESKTTFEESKELKIVFEALETMGVKEYVDYDPRVVRGLDYYTGVVFEGRDVGKSNRAILGGGRYDNLVKDVGGDPLTGVGFAMGDVVLPIILGDYELLPAFKPSPAQIMVTIFEEATASHSLMAASKLRQGGFSVQVYPEAEKLGKQFKYADKNDIPYTVVMGPDEISKGTVQVKDLKSREQVEMGLNALLSYFKGVFA